MTANQHHILYVQYNSLDKTKWDNCVRTAGNGLIYATSSYLDCMAKAWDALVLNDYEAVMPLTYNRKYGIHYLYQPFTCASLGVFGNGLDKQTVELFLNSIPAHFKYADIYFNHKNNFNISGFKLQLRTNYILSLNKPYKEIYSEYRSSYKQILKNSGLRGLKIVKTINHKLVIYFAEKQMKRVKPLRNNDLERFEKLCSALLQKGQLKAYGVYESNTLLASGIFFIDANRAYYVMAGNTAEGRKNSASHLLIDTFISDHCNSSLLLDFEGSTIESIAFFFSGFGAQKEMYPGLKYNRLNTFIRLFKT